MEAFKFINPKLVLCCVITLFGAACSEVNFNPEPTALGGDPDPAPTPGRTITKTEVVAYGNKQVDFLLVLDDSNSMQPELLRLAARMSNFMTSLDSSNIDWQMCLTTTRGYMVGGTLTHGINLNWNSYTPAPGIPAYVLKKGTANLNNIFTTTIAALPIGGLNSGDERGIKAAHDNFRSSPLHGCYRPGAAISVILISDEDERSVGGVLTNVKPTDATGAYIPFEAADYPATMLSQAKTSFGDDVRLTFNSIIVKPGDNVCELEQDSSSLSPSHPGHTYAEASALTDGGVGSICDADYSANLNTFKDKIVNSLSSLVLDCLPDVSTLKVTTGNTPIFGYKLEGKVLKFPSPLVEGTEIDLYYTCAN